MGVEQLGRYTVLKHLASGGMADVLLARSDGIENFERHVVLKRIRAELANDKRFITMFLDEACIAATLHHQNVVQVFDVGEDASRYFFAMEYIHGEDLRRLLSAVSKSKGHMPLGHVIAIVSAVAAGLHYAHERRSNDKKPLNIVHRDVSPSNILVGYDGSVKVVDFGIAKARTRQVQTGGGPKGKVSYMSPEQCKGESIDRRSDVYSLGVVLYELATTTRLFKGDSDYVVMDAIVTGKVPMPRVRRPDLPNELAQIIMKALSSDPARRYQSADELRLALEQFAIAANLTSSTSALASYMRKLFGEKAEPWLADDVPTRPGASLVDAGRTSSSHNSWTEEIGAITGETARTSASSISPRDTRTSMKLGWEQGRVTGASGGKKALWVSIPVVLALGGIAAWQFVVKPRMEKTAAATQPAPAQPAPAKPVAAEAAPAVPAAAAPAPTAAPAVAADPVEPADTAAPADPSAKNAQPVRRAQRRQADEPEEVAAAEPTPAPEVAAPVVAAPAVAAPPVTAPAPTPTPEPLPSVTVAILSNATVSAVAADNAASLSKCNADELSGNVSVSFQIDGTGKVVTSQLASSIKNPKIAGCILKAVQSWKFPRPPSGAAKGVYTISYQ